MNSNHYFCGNIEELDFWIKNQLISLINPPCICLLQGDLGSGKTTFVQFFLKNIGFNNVCSPTYGLHHVYEINNIEINHFDLYRLEEESELHTLNFYEILNNHMGYVFIEWPEKIKDWKQYSNVTVYHFEFLKISEPDRRIIKLNKKPN